LWVTPFWGGDWNRSYTNKVRLRGLVYKGSSQPIIARIAIYTKLDELTLDNNLVKIDRSTIIFIVSDNKPKRPSVGVIHELRQKLETGTPGVFTCGSPQLLGHYYEPALGQRI